MFYKDLFCRTIDHRTDMNFDLSESDILQQQELFKRVCSQNINSFDDSDDQIFEEKEQTFQTVIEKQGEKEGYSSDSDGDGDDDMEVDGEGFFLIKNLVENSAFLFFCGKN